jgi:tetratricopeptide repeat protein 21B
VQVLLKLKKLPEALKVIQEAKTLFTGTAEEMRVMITDCDIAIARGDFRAAVARLKAIPAESQHFVNARTSLADVYLNHRNDKKRYLECYEELAAQAPSAKTSIALGEACLKVNEPERAIDNFEQALKHDKADTGLRSKIGKALVFTHDYEKAKTYYREALAEQPKDTTLALELANLCMRLGKRRQGEYQEATSVLEQARSVLGFEDTQSITNNVKVHMMLAKLHRDCDNIQGATEALLQARTLHSRLKGEGVDVKRMGTDICFTLAEYHRWACILLSVCFIVLHF